MLGKDLNYSEPSNRRLEGLAQQLIDKRTQMWVLESYRARRDLGQVMSPLPALYFSSAGLRVPATSDS